MCEKSQLTGIGKLRLSQCPLLLAPVLLDDDDI
jgi:hypothetical protein